MPRPRSGTELESLEAQRMALERKIREVASREKAKKAAEDHRRWLLAGQVAVQHMQAAPDSEFFRTMMGLLDRHARSAADRALFGLPFLKNGNSSGDEANRGS
jgi:hypothetical protein